MVNKDYQKVYCNVFTDHIIDGFRETQLMQLLRGRRIIRRLWGPEGNVWAERV